MSLFNVLHLKRFICPRCGYFHDAIDIDLYFGFRYQDYYHIGDRYKWISETPVENGGEPIGGNLEGEGYGECLNCKKDFFVRVLVRDHILCEVTHDTQKKPYIK